MAGCADGLGIVSRRMMAVAATRVQVLAGVVLNGVRAHCAQFLDVWNVGQTANRASHIWPGRVLDESHLGVA